MRTIKEILDAAKKAQNITSDYGLSMATGIGESSLSSYRMGRRFPDQTTCQILAKTMGETPEIVVVEVEAQKAQQPEIRQMWVTIFNTLRAGVYQH